MMARRLHGKLNVLMALFFSLLISLHTFAQNDGLEELLVNRQSGCADISLNSSKYIPY